jgi:hypothetical protein
MADEDVAANRTHGRNNRGLLHSVERDKHNDVFNESGDEI